jgi:hypothetical protein
MFSLLDFSTFGRHGVGRGYRSHISLAFRSLA